MFQPYKFNELEVSDTNEIKSIDIEQLLQKSRMQQFEKT